MNIEISKDFIQKRELPLSFDLELAISFSISEIMDFLEIKTFGCAVFFVNGKERKDDYVLGNSDCLKVLPVFGGG